jgi:4-amino-4-deoxy-L-arabinose transferase-like glycosyltransferase
MGHALSQPTVELQAPRVKVWSSARSLVLLTAATLLCLLPFSGKAFHIDDPLFLWSAQHIVRHPLDPYGFQLNWYGWQMSMSEVTKNPPLACYYAAAIGALAGWSERALHLGFLLPTLLMVLGTYRLAQRFTQSPLIAAAATLLTPGVLVSASSVMCDTMMLALWIWAVIFWLEALDSGKWHLLLVSSILVGAAALTKYFGICLVPLLFAYSIARQRRLGAWAWYLALPIALLASYQFWTYGLYHHGMFSDALSYAPQRVSGFRFLIVFYPLVAASFVGGCTLSALILAPVVWPRRYILIAILVEVVAMAAGCAVLGSSLHATHTGMVLEQHWALIAPQLGLFIASGASVLALAAVDLWKRRDADSVLLALWVLGTFLFTAFLNWTVNARSVLPLIPAAGILLARRLDALGIAFLKPLRWKVAAALAVSGMVSFCVAQADADWANSARQMASVIRERTQNEAGAVWFQGHWGFQYYMQPLGAAPFDLDLTAFRPGDLLVTPTGDLAALPPPRRFVASEEQLDNRLRLPVVTMRSGLEAGFYASVYGSLPFVFGTVPTDQYKLFRIAAPVRPRCDVSPSSSTARSCAWASN